MDAFFSPVARGIQEGVYAIGRGIRGLGSGAQSALDQPAHALGLRHNPTKPIHHAIDGAVVIVQGTIEGTVDSVVTAGDAITTGLDSIPDTFVGAKGPQLPPAPPFLGNSRR